jgi:dTMP kinase
MSGRLVSFEGGEGAGKSTAISAAADWLAAQGIAVVRTREPGGTIISEAIRGLLLDPANAGMCAETELLLMFAARAQLVRDVVRPALQRGAWVLADRFTDASFAYQGGGRGIDSARIAELERWTVGLRPHRSLLLDVCVETGLQRARGRETEADRIEQEQPDFFDRVRTNYRARASADPQRWRIIDASLPPAEVAAQVTAVLAEMLTDALPA